MMTALDFPLRFVPRRRPKFLVSLAITVASLGAAVLVRSLVLGGGAAVTPTATVFPAIIVIAIYAGWRWALLVILALGALSGWATLQSDDAVAQTWILLGLFFGSAAVTAILAGAVRELLIRLNDEVQARQKAEGQRTESENRFQTLADAAPTLMWISNPDRTRSFVNRAYVDFVGADEETTLKTDWRTRIHPDDIERVIRDQVAGEASGEPFVLEARFQRGDGEYRWLRSISRPRHLTSGEFDGFIGIAYDITDAKQAEADLKRINELLNERVELALAERDEAQGALMQAQKLEAVGQLTGGVAHDFNNLLTVIIGALDILQRKPDDTERRTRLIEAALSAARRGENLTQQLLAFARKQPQRTERRNIDNLLASTAPLLQRALGEEHRLELDLRANDACANVDPGQLEAAVLNLVVNARDAIGADGHVAMTTSQVSLAARDDRAAGDYICIAVSDDGAGMDKETAAHVFEPFFTTKPVGKGTGLGLSQVYGFARQSGGYVEIESEPGAGATIRILLPAIEQAEDAPAAADLDTSASAEGRYRVLLVEDDPDVAELVQAMLTELGHSVIAATDVRSALRRVASEPELDLVLTDVIMPGGKTGVDLARDLTRLRPGLPVILSSGYTGEVLAGVEDAPWPLLRKPYTIDALATMIAGVKGEATVH